MATAVRRSKLEGIAGLASRRREILEKKCGKVAWSNVGS
jgi:hypothetical protein